jgi:hypothetical protein
MTYRDDVSALRARIDEHQKEIDRLQTEPRIRALEERLATLSAQQEQLGHPFSRGMKIVGLVVAVGALAGGWSLYEQAERARRDAQMASQQAVNASSRASDAFNGVQQLQAGVAALTALPATLPDFDPVVRPATVTATTGEAPVAKGGACTVTVIPARAGAGLNCQVRVQCGEKRIYGRKGVGYLVCGVEGRLPTYGKDEDPTGSGGDPRVELDLPSGRVVVSDEDPNYSVTIELDAR